ncbi:cyclic AMP-dependent transcription factor ATF-3-like [Mytilus galloprovincialis]|uniref:cyclic AMP-dependent transcription factor ATF-3-like n=1 Tax=Mytilus galloprovincialis TaxID=29158 RepID=UPI003F7C1D58
MLDFECPSMWMTPLDNYPMSVLETEEADKFMEATFFYDAELKPSQQTDGFAEATLTALETGELTPLVKEELKYTIQSRRLANGQSELGVEFTEPEQGQLTEEEKEKIVKRREQNKLAARRFRQRRRAKGPVYAKEVSELEADNTRKLAEIRRLRKERDELQAMLQNHMLVCPTVTIQTG